MKETWKPTEVVGYEISSHGRVRSFWENRYLRTTAQKYLKHSLNSNGYPIVNLRRGNTKLVHVLVLEAFVCKRPNGLQGCHNDGNPLNNKLSNLRWDTVSSNVMDAIEHGTFKLGEKHPFSKLTSALVEQAKAEYFSGITSQRALAKRFGVSQSTLRFAILGKTWRHVSKKQ